ncbi:MAG TPA: hypothetical protein VE987_06140 [Polyangiaceae bacterium]|nr:hypothetical protein [Polyangiaceae bacterium]
MKSDLDRFLALVRRELGAVDAQLLEADQQPEEQSHTLCCRMADGRGIAARFASVPDDAEAKSRRLEMLVSTFDAVVDEALEGRRARSSVVRSLPDELSALCARAGALNAIVIDANSPVVWGAARPQGVIVLRPRASSPAGKRRGEGALDHEPKAALASRRALRVVRSLPDLAALRKGKHVRLVARTGEAPLVAHSFAGIYLLVVVFDAPFDELRAERAIAEALPRVERLVLALPPLDPAPHAGVIALRRRRRR